MGVTAKSLLDVSEQTLDLDIFGIVRNVELATLRDRLNSFCTIRWISAFCGEIREEFYGLDLKCIPKVVCVSKVIGS